MNKKKMTLGIILAVILLIGIIIVAVKGFNVGLSLRPHHTFYFVFDQKYNIEDIEKVCDEVFKDKNYRIRGVEVFDDAVYIEASTISKDEEKLLSEKLDALYKVVDTEAEVETEDTPIHYSIYNDSNIKITDELKPYIMPLCVSSLIILIYTAIRFKKINDGKIYKTLISVIIEGLIVVLLPLSLIAICRIPLEKITFSILIILEIIYLIIKYICMENKLKEV